MDNFIFGFLLKVWHVFNPAKVGNLSRNLYPETMLDN